MTQNEMEDKLKKLENEIKNMKDSIQTLYNGVLGHLASNQRSFQKLAKDLKRNNPKK